ncbi:hypothetical protein GON26_10265 [Flavobacterium sp. GA093]|uniref:Lipoprotein n=1 Tax=Flavobacterium hydrocarbonoxydans TaxID=2683249 RepID=A0A6I4NSW6_9FLAO|nr:hypothetical protein [Flavobacterium hydrocarbonoxydans]MWB94749.1 hypothetical protein [Flavobacterium hydrocarbonoxydans]
MKRILFLIAFLFFISCKNEKTIDSGKIEVVNSLSRIIKKRDFPLKNFSNIELVSYYNRVVWDTIKVNDKSPFNKILVDNYRLTFDSLMIQERVTLNKIQEKELLNLMISDTCSTGETPADCYKPRHMILFRDHKNRIMGYSEFCIACAAGRNSENLEEFQKYCYSDMEILFKKYGIKLFVHEGDEDDTQENREYDFLKHKGYIKN